MKDTMFDLQRFAEGSAPAGAGGEGTTGASSAQQSASQNAGGSAPATGGENTTHNAPADPRPAKVSFDELLQDEEYKAAYDKKVRESMDGRFKTARANAQRLQEMEPVMRQMMQRYGVQNVADLSAAMNADTAWLEQKAAEEGMDVEHFREMQDLRGQVAAYQQAEQESEVQRQWQALQQEGEAIKAQVPDFDFAREMENERFARMVISMQHSGFSDPLKTAYYALHHEDIVSRARTAAASAAAERVVDGIQTNAKRPPESGSQVGVGMAYDWSNLTKKERADVRALASRGIHLTPGKDKVPGR